MKAKLSRAEVLQICRVAGYHDDGFTFCRAYVENRVSYQAANAAWRSGQQQKQKGVVCDCPQCKKVL